MICPWHEHHDTSVHTVQAPDQNHHQHQVRNILETGHIGDMTGNPVPVHSDHNYSSKLVLGMAINDRLSPSPGTALGSRSSSV